MTCLADQLLIMITSISLLIMIFFRSLDLCWSLISILERPQSCDESEVEEKRWVCRCYGNCLGFCFHISPARSIGWTQCKSMSSSYDYCHLSVWWCPCLMSGLSVIPKSFIRNSADLYLSLILDYKFSINFYHIIVIFSRISSFFWCL